MGLVVRKHALMGLVESAHSDAESWQAWAGEIYQAARCVFTSSEINTTVVLRGETNYQLLGGGTSVPGLFEFCANFCSSFPGEHLDPYWRYSGHVGTLKEARGSDFRDAALDGFHQLLGADQILGMVATANQHSISIGIPNAQTHLEPSDRQLLLQVALHLESGLRLRVNPQLPVAWLDTDGVVQHAEGYVARTSAAREQLTSHVRSVERQRTQQNRQRPDAIDTWKALVGGRWTLVEKTQRGQPRHYAVLEVVTNQRLRAVNALEMQAIELSARGTSGKNVAYALGVTPGTVSKLLAGACLKLGISNRTQLVRLAAQLLGFRASCDATFRLTSAERHILTLVRLGWTNTAIAAARQRSERTIANQIAALLRKFNAPTRRALAAMPHVGQVPRLRADLTKRLQRS